MHSYSITRKIQKTINVSKFGGAIRGPKLGKSIRCPTLPEKSSNTGAILNPTNPYTYYTKDLTLMQVFVMKISVNLVSL